MFSAFKIARMNKAKSKMRVRTKEDGPKCSYFGMFLF